MVYYYLKAFVPLVEKINRCIFEVMLLIFKTLQTLTGEIAVQRRD